MTELLDFGNVNVYF